MVSFRAGSAGEGPGGGAAGLFAGRCRCFRADLRAAGDAAAAVLRPDDGEWERMRRRSQVGRAITYYDPLKAA
jgi:hypothetical protein